MTYTPGIDISAWQDNDNTPQQIDWQKAADKGTKFAFIRCCNGFTPDSDFEYNWREARRVGILRGAYIFHDYRVTPSGQAEFFAARLKDDPGELPPVLDIEKYWTPYPTRAGWLSAISIMVETLKKAGHPRVIFYSNPDIILNTLSPIPNELLALPLWIAHYGVNQPTAKAVAPWGSWTFWQYSSTGPGLDYGMESKGLDMDWFNGNETELCQFAGVEGVPPAPELTDAEKLRRLWEWYRELH